MMAKSMTILSSDSRVRHLPESPVRIRLSGTSIGVTGSRRVIIMGKNMTANGINLLCRLVPVLGGAVMRRPLA